MFYLPPVLSSTHAQLKAPLQFHVKVEGQELYRIIYMWDISSRREGRKYS